MSESNPVATMPTLRDLALAYKRIGWTIEPYVALTVDELTEPRTALTDWDAEEWVQIEVSREIAGHRVSLVIEPSGDGFLEATKPGDRFRPQTVMVEDDVAEALSLWMRFRAKVRRAAIDAFWASCQTDGKG
jgi:hypothetical protein